MAWPIHFFPDTDYPQRRLGKGRRLAKNQMVDIDWSIPKINQLRSSSKEIQYYLHEQGHSEATIENYIGNVLTRIA